MVDPTLPAETRPIGLSDVPWRWYDGLIGLAVLLPARFLLLLPRPLLLEVARWPQWALVGGIYVLPVAWRLLFPLCLARWRQPAFRFTVPAVRVWVREALAALMILGIVWGLLLAGIYLVQRES